MPVVTRHADASGQHNQMRKRGVFQAPGTIVIEKQRAGLRIQPDHSNKKCQITNASRDEGLFGCRRGSGFLIPESDEQIRGKANQLPAHEEQQQTVRNHHAQHRGRKERQEAKEASEIFIMGHVARAVDKDQQADKRDHHQHHRGQRIEHPAELQPFTPILKPGKVEDLHRLSLAAGSQYVRKRTKGKQKRQPHRTNRKRSCEPAIPLFGKSTQPRREARECGNQPKISDNPGHVVSAKSYRVDADFEFRPFEERGSTVKEQYSCGISSGWPILSWNLPRRYWWS